MGSSFGLVDFRGRPVDTRRHGGVRASMFIYIMVWLGNVVNIAKCQQHEHGELPPRDDEHGRRRGGDHQHQLRRRAADVHRPGGFPRRLIRQALLHGPHIRPVEILGYILLAIQSHVPSLHPPACIVNEPHNCEPVHDTNLSLLLLGMYMICVGEGAIRACLPALGGDQFDNADPVERRLESSFFNWYTFSVSMGSFFGLIFVVWLENNKGWGVGFAVCAAIVLLGLLIWAAGFPFYRNQVPAGSPITRIMQVIIVACKKRNLKLPANPDDDLNQMTDDDAKGLEVLQRTEGLQFLDKAAIKIENGARGPWSLCNVTQVEETKIACRMVPIFLTSAVGYMPVSIILNFTVQQGNTMDTRLGAIRVSPATLFVIPTVFQLVILVAYDRLLVPLLRRATGYVGGVTHPQRIGVGFVAAVPASAVAALVEARRKTVAEGSGLVDSPAGGVPMSVFWLTPQFFLLGVVDVTSFVCWLLIVARSKPPRS
ncbi:hypothetical protein CFC21_073535 [Triticum aestivum]|uniref:Uncharacterized protein n=3 Tax=Triticum TaxID=4564 RepID=A0A9R1AQQ5_TRITD|nr:protein NRT1/ PTR FAMILY 4.6-like isoform X2 [Triticum aestivum]KAF7067677.1 hypothetical protein CFC21_073535 [Triticum aestivum]VAI36723.1 unnamed protein product [Triticum turgidum subsp. durum]